MDVSSFNALYKFVSRQHGEVPPPRLVLAVLCYLAGLGYEVVCRGDEAAWYAEGGDANGPARHSGGRGDGRGDGSPSTQERGDSSSHWYALDMVRDTNAQRVVDQMLVHVRMAGDTAFVHCSRTAWVGPMEGSTESAEFRRVEVGASGHGTATSCTLSGDDMIELRVSRFDDGAGLRNVEDLCASLQSFFCRGSAREGGDAAVATTGARAAMGSRHPPASGPAGPYDGPHAYDGYVGGDGDLDRLRVGQSDLDPIDRRGAGRGLGPDGMMVGPHHPIFGRGRMEPPPGHEGHLPPGARWDPIAPPGMPGFFPGNFERGRGRGRGRGGDEIHPDIMQPGRGGFGTGFDGLGGGF